MIAPALWLAGAITIAIAQQPSPAPVAAPTVRGRIVAEGSSAPIARVRVTVISNDRTAAPVFTDADGRFVTTIPAHGTFRLRAAKAGFIAKEIARAQVTGPAIDIALTRGAVIAGRFASHDGEPVMGATISVRPAGTPLRLASAAPPPGTAATVTDDLGEFRVSGLPAGRYVVSSDSSLSCTSRENFVECLRAPPSTQEVDVREGEEATVSLTGPVGTVATVVNLPADIAANTASTGAVRGRVTAGEAPVAGISVGLALDPADSGGMPRLFGAVTDALGRYEILRLPAGHFQLSVGRPSVSSSAALAGFPATSYSASFAGSPNGSAITLSEGEQVHGANIALLKRGAITGTIYDEAGEPMEGLTVRAMRARFVDGRMRLDDVALALIRKTDDRGRYRIFGLSPGNYHIVASEGPSAVVPGGPPVHASLQVYYPGRTSAAEGLSLRVDAEAEVAGVDLVFAPHRGARIVGEARLSSGLPINGTAVLTSSARSGVLASEPRAVPIRDGRFEFLHVPPGEYAVQAAAWKTWEVSEEFGAALVRVGGEETALLTVTTAPPSTLSGTIRLEGRPGAAVPSDFRLRTLPSDPDFILALPSVEQALSERVEVRPDGRFTISGLVGPRRIAAAAPPEWWLKSAVIDGIDAADDPFAFGTGASHTNVDVVFASGAAAISGRVTNGRGELLAGYPVIVFPADASRIYYRSRYLGRTFSDRSGRFTVPNLPPGNYSVVAVDAMLQADDWQHPGLLQSLASAARRVTARQGARETIDLQPAPLPR
jgi:protocatechuate 3,4-dioxygenase beta subunit